jgi:glycosyltransferase involved in cell wall biosynthesis
MPPHRVAFLISHPIQYNSPLFKKIAEEPGIDLTVYYCSKEGLERMEDKGFGKDIAWDIPLLEGYKCKFLNNYSILPRAGFAPFGLFNPGIISELKRGKFDALIVHGWHYLTHWIAFAAAFMTKTPVFLRSEMPLSQERLKPRLIILLKSFFLRPLFKRTSAFLAIGTENREFYRFYGADEKMIFMAPYSVDNERFMAENEKLKMEREGLREGLGISRDAKVILFVGKLIPKKRPLDLLKAYGKVTAADKALVFVGDGRLRGELESFAKERRLENVFFAGFKNQSEIAQFYALSDILVLPSGAGETWGLVVNEAMCFGLPVVVSDLCGCVADLLEDGRNGYKFRAGDIDSLVSAIDKVMQEGQLPGMGGESLRIIAKWSYQEDIEGIKKSLTVSLTENKDGE